MSFHAKRVLINGYVISNFNYCPLVWIFPTAKSLSKIESLQKRALCFLYNNYSISHEGLLEKAGKVKISVSRLRIVLVEIYKTVNKLKLMNNIFKVKEYNQSGSRTAATSKMERFVIIVNGWKPLTIITKRSILDVAAALDPPLITD